MASNCQLIKQNLWFCYYCNTEVDHKATDCTNKGTIQSPKRFENNCIRGNNNITGRGNNRGRGIDIRGVGKENFRGRVFNKMHLYKEQ